MEAPVKSSASNPWIEHRTEGPQAKLRLFCFPYSGAAANVFRLWGKSLPPGIGLCPVQVPGRATRLSEPVILSAQALAQAAVAGLSQELDRPFALYGHSLGGLIAFEVARELRRRGGPSPLHLFVSARVAPQLPLQVAHLHGLPEREFLRRFQERYNSIHPQVMREPDLLAMLLPTLRADLKVHETYEHQCEPPLAIPISAFGAERDTTVPREQLAPWRDLTTAAFSLRMFAGDHLFIQSEEAAFLAALSDELKPLIEALPLHPPR
jgi:surfactin synthase thioesterase subunit